jgi:hypothetical protein
MYVLIVCLYVLVLDVHTYSISYVLALKNSTWHCVAYYPSYLRFIRGMGAIRALSRRFYPKRLTSVNTHIDTPTAESTMQGDSQLVRSS